MEKDKGYIVRNELLEAWDAQKFHARLNSWEAKHPDAIVLDRQFKMYELRNFVGWQDEYIHFVMIIRYKEWQEKE